MTTSDGNGDRAALADGPLQGLRVVEFGQLLAGPYVGTLLGDFGADVAPRVSLIEVSAGPSSPCSSTAASTMRWRVSACCSARFPRV